MNKEIPDYIKEAAEKAVYWKQRCEAAEKLMGVFGNSIERNI